MQRGGWVEEGQSDVSILQFSAFSHFRISICDSLRLAVEEHAQGRQTGQRGLGAGEGSVEREAAGIKDA